MALSKACMMHAKCSYFSYNFVYRSNIFILEWFCCRTTSLTIAIILWSSKFSRLYVLDSMDLHAPSNSIYSNVIPIFFFHIHPRYLHPRLFIYTWHKLKYLLPRETSYISVVCVHIITIDFFIIFILNLCDSYGCSFIFTF